MNPLWVVILTLGLLVAPLAAGAQHAKVPVIGMLMVSAGPKDSVVESFRQGLRDQGYVEGRNVAIEFRSAAGRADRLPRLAKELVDRRVDVIFWGAEPALLALKQATTAVPIVMVAYHFDPVASGLIASIARPGGNITGVFPLHTELLGKRLQLLKEALPGVSRIAVMWDSFGKQELNELEHAARALGVRLDPIEVRASYELETSVKAAVRRGARALAVLFSPNFYVQRFRVARLVTEQGLATVWDDRDYVEAGGFMSYGPNYRDTFERAAYFVDRILKGAKPADLPVEQPTKFELVINLKTAKALGLTIPQSLLLRADEVIK